MSKQFQVMNVSLFPSIFKHPIQTLFNKRGLHFNPHPHQRLANWKEIDSRTIVMQSSHQAIPKLQICKNSQEKEETP